MKHLTQTLKTHGPLLIILAVFSALALFQSVVLPLGEAADETDHYQYHRFVAQTGRPPLTAEEREAAGFKGGLAPLYYWLTAWPVALVGADAQPDVRRVDGRPERHLPTDGLGINHVLHTLDEQWPWRGQPLAWHLVRLLSIPLGGVTIIATYALARRLRPDAPLIAVGAAAFVALLPRFVFSAAVINDDNLVFALTALLLLVQVILLQQAGPPAPRLMAAFGALFGLALLTKYFSLILLPEVLFTLAVVGWQSRRGADFGLPLAAFGLALFLTAGGWFIFIAVRFNQIDELGWIAGLAAALGEPQITEGLVGLLSGQAVRPVAATYSLPAWLGLLYRSFWFEFGWMRVFAPAWVYWLFGLFTALALLGLAKRELGGATPQAPPATAGRAALSTHTHSKFIPLLLALHLALFAVVVGARYLLSATIDTGQGRHLYPALPVIALLLSLGWYEWLIKKKDGGASPPGLQPANPPATRYSLLAGLLLALTFLLPAFSIHHPQFTIRHYHTHPVTTAPPPLPPERRLDLEFAPGLSLRGYHVGETVAAGDALPVTLIWHAGQEATQDYLLALCLRTEAGQPVACWRGHFEDGRYPARAWEAGDTLSDTVYLPLPVCYRLATQPHTLSLALWALDPASPQTTPLAEPLLVHHFDAPAITITPTDSLSNRPQSVEWWQQNTRLTGPTELTVRQSLTQLAYETPVTLPGWPPLGEADRLHLPCDDGPESFATATHFVVDPTHPAGEVSAPGLPPLSVNLRDRRLAPVTSTLTFSHTLAPLTLATAGQTVTLTAAHTTGLPAPPLLAANRRLPVTVQWQSRRWQAEPLVVALKLLDKDFAVGGERVASLGDRYPNVLWAPTELVAETYPLTIRPDAPPGLYRLELSLLRQDNSLPGGFENLPLFEGGAEVGVNLYPLTVRLPDPARGQPPAQPLAAQIGDSIRLTGFDVNPLLADSPQKIELALYWESTADIGADYTVFTQLVGPDGQVWAQWDNPPQAGRYPTSAWAAQDAVVDRYTLTLRQGAPPGDYRLLVGMYDPTSGARLPATLDGQPQPDNALLLTTLAVNPVEQD